MLKFLLSWCIFATWLVQLWGNTNVCYPRTNHTAAVLFLHARKTRFCLGLSRLNNLVTPGSFFFLDDFLHHNQHVTSVKCKIGRNPYAAELDTLVW